MAKRSSAPRISSRNAVIRQFTPQKKVYFVSWDLTESCKDRSSKFITQKKILPPQNRVCKWHTHSSKHRLQRNRYVLGSPPKEVAHTQLRTGCKAISPAPRISPKGPAKTSVIKPFTTLKFTPSSEQVLFQISKQVAHTQLRTGCKAISPAPRISPKGPAKTSVIKPFTTQKKVYFFLRTGFATNLQVHTHL